MAPVEARFFQNLLDELGIEDLDAESRNDPAQWDRIRERLQAVFGTRSRDEWCDILEGTDTCFSPVLELGEVAEHPHIQARQTIVDVGGIRQPAPAPRFSKTPSHIRSAAGGARGDAAKILEAWGAAEGALQAAARLNS